MIEFLNIYKQFGTVKALSDVTVSFNDGHSHALIGPNGSGKTTILNIIAGFYKPDKGEVLFRNGRSYSLNGLPTFRRSHMGIGITFQEPRGFQDLSVEENLILGMMEWGSDNLLRQGMRTVPLAVKFAQVEKLLELGRLTDKRSEKVSGLSYGQRKILDILCLLGRGCKTLMLDEPFAGVDPKNLDTILELLSSNVTENSGTLIIVSHEMSIVNAVVDKAFLLDEGRIVIEGLPGDVIRSDTFRRVYLG